MRTPSIRNPRSFWDVFVVTVLALAVVTVELYLTDDVWIRREVVVFMAIVFLWNAWAIVQITGRNRY